MTPLPPDTGTPTPEQVAAEAAHVQNIRAWLASDPPAVLHADDVRRLLAELAAMRTALDRAQRIEQSARALVEPGWDVGHDQYACNCAGRHEDGNHEPACTAWLCETSCLQCAIDELARSVRPAEETG